MESPTLFIKFAVKRMVPVRCDPGFGLDQTSPKALLMIYVYIVVLKCPVSLLSCDSLKNQRLILHSI